MSGAARHRASRGVLYVWAILMAPLVYGFSFPMHRWTWLAWVGLIPWCAALRIASTRTALLICWISTFAGAYLCTPWLAPAVANYYQQPLALGILLFAAVWVVTIFPYVSLFTIAYRHFGQHPSARLPLLAAALWTASEVLRVRLFPGEPFGLYGYSQVNLTPLVQIADVTGIYGVSFLLIAVNAAVAEFCLAYSRHPLVRCPVLTPRQAWRGAGLVATMVGCCLAYGVWRPLAFAAGPSSASVRIGIVQPNLDLGSQWRQEFYGRNLDELLRLTWQIIHNEKPQIVIWPESAMTFFLESEPSYRAAIGRLLAPGVQLVSGGPRQVGGPVPRYYNSALLIASDGSIAATYDKQQLLPFAEQFPFGGIALLKRDFGRVREFTPGGPARLLPTAAGPAGIVICNEVMFGEIVADRVRTGAAFIVTLTNDAWLGDRMFVEQALDMARLRAVEQRRYLVRASISGPSAIIDPIGRVMDQTEADRRATLLGILGPLHGQTVYARCGDLFGLLCMLVPGTAWIAQVIRARGRKPYVPVPVASAGVADHRAAWAPRSNAAGSGASSNP